MKIITLLLSLTLISCTTFEPRMIPESEIVSYDLGKLSKEEQQKARKQKAQKTADTILFGVKENISVMAVKTVPYKEIIGDEVVQDKWDVVAANASDDDKCVTIIWQLMDFKYISEFPTEFFLKKHEMKKVGTMIQVVWEIQGVKFVPESSGYIYWLGVRDPVEDAKKGDECTFNIDEDDVTER